MNTAVSSYSAIANDARALPLLGRMAGIAAAIFAVAGLADFPFWRTLFATLLLAYTALLVWRPSLWLVIVPILLPTVDLGAWTGRFFFNELDIVLLVTIAVIYLKEPLAALPQPWRPGHRLTGFFALSVAVSTLIGLLPLAPIDANSFASYLSPYNALRVAKGFLWAWLLTPYVCSLLRKDREHGLRCLAWGMTLGVMAFGISILWERGVFVHVFHFRSIYGLVGSILDESSGYRATGLFSGMHTGGAEIDSYVSIALAFVLLPFLVGGSWRLRVAGALAICLGMYGALSTFSRGTYGAVVAIALTAGLTWTISRAKRQLDNPYALTWGGITTIAGSDIAWLTFGYGGAMAVLACGVTYAVAVVTGYLMRPRGRIAHLVSALIPAAIGALLMLRAILTSKWHDTDHGTAVAVSVAATLVIALLSLEFGRRVRSRSGFFKSVTLVGITVVLWLVAIPAFSGYRMTHRFDTTTRDANERISHWLDALSFIKPDALHGLFGMGLGSFPRLYFLSHVGDASLASYRFISTPGLSYLTLGQGEFAITQRVSVEPHTTYRLTVRFRGDSAKPKLSVALCPRNILHTEYVGGCVGKVAKLESADTWGTWTATIESGRLGRQGWLYWPTALELRNASGRHGIVDVSQVRVTRPDGVDIVANGNFSAGSDRWFLVSDTEHLEWHPKNLFVAAMVEQGAFGAILLAVLMVTGAVRQWKAARCADALACVLLPSLAGAFTVGMIGTIVDVPRVALLFYLMLFLSVSAPTTEGVRKDIPNRVAHRLGRHA